MNAEPTITLTPPGETTIQLSKLPVAEANPHKIKVNVKVYVPQTPEAVQIPGRLKLGTVSDWRLRVVRPISVELTRENESVVAFAPDFDEFGSGINSSEAVEDLQRTISELYFSLVESEGRLGPDLQRLLGKLKGYLSIIQA